MWTLSYSSPSTRQWITLISLYSKNLLLYKIYFIKNSGSVLGLRLSKFARGRLCPRSGKVSTPGPWGQSTTAWCLVFGVPRETEERVTNVQKDRPNSRIKQGFGVVVRSPICPDYVRLGTRVGSQGSQRLGGPHLPLCPDPSTFGHEKGSLRGRGSTSRGVFR